MEWRYKTVHYAVKKDGLLGGAFLDEEEMEASLNNYGEQGWELVSLLEVRDGVVAVFKQEKDLFQGGRLAEIVPEKIDDTSKKSDLAKSGATSHAISSVCLEELAGNDAESCVVRREENQNSCLEKEHDGSEGTFAEIRIE